ncbi:HAD domain-containing protein [Roseateles sp. DXS20W]|uniref:HAD domain-containing protein n=1 Tax=Pelomonas lactea TaxID=3299030 RepID=A0ABW7GP40_9BURK
MRVLFIDIDGVFHPAGDGSQDTGPRFIWLPLLAEVLAPHPDVVIAVHSTWRYDHTLDELQELLASLGKRPVVAVPRGPRSEAITWFLQMNRAVVSHRILDDAPDEFGTEPPAELIVCESKRGLTTPGVIDALRRWLAA